MKIFTSMKLFGMAAALMIGVAGCDFDVEDSGELPDVDVEAGEMPEVDADAADVEVETDDVEVPVPTDIDVEAADADEE